MAQTYNLYCADCKKEIWCGQTGQHRRARVFYLYGGKDGRATAKFLLDHHGHELRFFDEDHMVDVEIAPDDG